MKNVGLSTKQSTKFRQNLRFLALLAENLDDHHADANDENNQHQDEQGHAQSGPGADMVGSAVPATKPPSAR